MPQWFVWIECEMKEVELHGLVLRHWAENTALKSGASQWTTNRSSVFEIDLVSDSVREEIRDGCNRRQMEREHHFDSTN